MKSLKLIFVLVLAACSGSGVFSTSNETKAKSENDKPTEDSEGVPGYLADPKMIAVEEKADRLEVTVPFDALQVLVDDLTLVEIRALGTTSDLLQAADLSTKIATVEANVLDRSDVKKDQPAKLSVPIPEGEQLLILELAFKTAPAVLGLQKPQGGNTPHVLFGAGFNTFTPFSRDDIVNSDIELDDTTQSIVTIEEDIEVVTDDPSETPCAGVRVGGGCWYLAGLGKSCDNLCADKGGYSELTASFAGSGGTFAQCLQVVGELRPNFIQGVSAKGCGLGWGCFLAANVAQRCEDTTTADQAHPSFQRVCACNE